MKTKVKLAAIAKDEAAYIPQWVHHHLLFGFQEIEIWLNNTTDNSVELLAELQAMHPEGVIKFQNADMLLHKCLAENLQFQQLSYTEIYDEALSSGECSHIMFLDLDEFWTPDNFTSTINDFIRNSAEFDAMSFQWLIDTPDVNKHISGPPFSVINALQKNRHVKTLTKLTPQMKELSVHNHIIEKGKYRLADGEEFPGTHQETIHKSLVPISYQAQNQKIIPKAFVLHQINRTPIEYLSSLLRGRGHKNDGNIFKMNRIGYLLDGNSSPVINFKVSAQGVLDYQDSLGKYCAPISRQLSAGRQFILDRFYSALGKLCETPELLMTYRDQLRGVKINDLVSDKLITPHTFHSIDKTSIAGSKLFIEGWVFDALSNDRPELSFQLDNGTAVDFAVEFHERPDVAKLYPDATTACGFKATISLSESSPTPTLLIKSSGGMQKVIIAI